MWFVYGLAFSFWWFNLHFKSDKTDVHLWKLSWWTKRVSITNLCLRQSLFSAKIGWAFCRGNQGDTYFQVNLLKYIIALYCFIMQKYMLALLLSNRCLWIRTMVWKLQCLFVLFISQTNAYISLSKIIPLLSTGAASINKNWSSLWLL